MRSDDFDSVGELYTEADFRQLVVSIERQLFPAASVRQDGSSKFVPNYTLTHTRKCGASYQERCGSRARFL